MSYVFVDTPIERGSVHPIRWVAIPGSVAVRLHAAGLLSRNPDAIGPRCDPRDLAGYVAVTDNWAGQWWTVAELIQIPGAFLPGQGR